MWFFLILHFLSEYMQKDGTIYISSDELSILDREKIMKELHISKNHWPLIFCLSKADLDYVNLGSSVFYIIKAVNKADLGEGGLYPSLPPSLLLFSLLSFFPPSFHYIYMYFSNI